MNRVLIGSLSLLGIMMLFPACSKKKDAYSVKNVLPNVTENGLVINFPDTTGISFFQTEDVSTGSLTGDINVPAKIAAIVMRPNESSSQSLVLFDDAELAGEYTQYLQHLNNIKQIEKTNITQRATELKLTDDLAQHGAATGRDLLDAQMALSIEESNLANEKASVIEHVAKLTAGGFNSEKLRKASLGTTYIICDIPENKANMIKDGGDCKIVFTSFPEQPYAGKIDEIAEMVDNSTRMLKGRILVLGNSTNQLKVGMFATVTFPVEAGNHIAVDENAIVTVEGKNYVFVKTGNNTFERRLIKSGSQVGNRIVVYSGLKDGDIVAVKGVMQLKGLSFGY